MGVPQPSFQTLKGLQQQGVLGDQMEASVMPVQDGVLLLSTSSQELIWRKTLLRSPAVVKPLTVGMGRKFCPSKAPGGLGLLSQLHRFSKGWILKLYQDGAAL